MLRLWAEREGSPTPDGAVTIDGRSWTVANTANASTFDLVPGTGLRVAPAQNAV